MTLVLPPTEFPRMWLVTVVNGSFVVVSGTVRFSDAPAHLAGEAFFESDEGVARMYGVHTRFHWVLTDSLFATREDAEAAAALLILERRE